MKRIKFEKKLNLKKELIANLTHSQMNFINGGETIKTLSAPNSRVWCCNDI